MIIYFEYIGDVIIYKLPNIYILFNGIGVIETSWKTLFFSKMFYENLFF